MEPLTSNRREAARRPLALDALLERYEPEVIDLLGRRARIRLATPAGGWDAVLDGDTARLEPASGDADAVISADEATWTRIARDVRGGMDAFRARRLRIRRNLHLGVGFLAATSANDEPGRLRFASHRTPTARISLLEAGVGSPVLCLPGLGGTKASFISTVAALAPNRRVIALDLPGFGDSGKPITGRYNASWFAQAVVELADELGLDRFDVIGNSMGGRVALELGLAHPERVRRAVMLSPAMAWLRRDRNIARLLALPLPRLGMLQPTPRAIVEPLVRRIVPGGDRGWAAAGVDEFLRAFCTPAGRFAFYESARSIYLDEPDGDGGFWKRLEEMTPEALFVWGRQDRLVPIAFMKHVERALPSAEHLELECGHVPQLEAPERTHTAIERFLSA
jgi:pimeloyl-ACP methyl ester carboxylesterase